MAVIKGDIFDNLGIAHSRASDLRMRADLLDANLRVVEPHNLTQKKTHMAVLALRRPGFDDKLGEIATKLAGRPTWEEFNKMNALAINCLILPWCAMWLGIEQDGETHS